MKKSIITGFICLLLGFLLGYCTYYYTTKDLAPKEIIIRDTITTERLVEKTVFKNIVRVDTIRDTIQLADNDTIIAVEVPISQYSYKDTLKTDSTTAIIGIDYSGYNAKLDKVELDYIYKSHKEKTKHFGQFVGVGVQVGYGLGINTTPRFEPYIGIGITYGWGYRW